MSSTFIPCLLFIMINIMKQTVELLPNTSATIHNQILTISHVFFVRKDRRMKTDNKRGEVESNSCFSMGCHSTGDKCFDFMHSLLPVQKFSDLHYAALTPIVLYVGQANGSNKPFILAQRSFQLQSIVITNRKSRSLGLICEILASHKCAWWMHENFRPQLCKCGYFK